MLLCVLIVVSLGFQHFSAVGGSQVPTCKDVKQKSDENISKNNKDIDDFEKLVEELLLNEELQDELPSEYNATIARFGANNTYNTECQNCAEKNVYQYEKCLKEEEETLIKRVKKLQTTYKTITEIVKDVKKANRKNSKDRLKYLIEELFDLLIPVKRVQQYYNKKLESFYKDYIRAKRVSQNYIITNDVYNIGKTLKTSFNSILKNYGCGIEKGLQDILAAVEEVITPFNPANYPIPTLQAFAATYGRLVEHNGVLELIRSYDIVFAKAEEFRLKELRTSGSSGASIRLRNALEPVNDLLKNSTCKTSDKKDATELLRCINAARNNSLDMPTLRFRVDRCYADFTMQNYCYNSARVPEDVKFKELALCISLALKSSDEQYMECCFKYFQ